MKLSTLLLTFITVCPSLCAQDTTTKTPKPLEKYPTADKIWLSIEDGQIKAADQKIYRAPSEGYITFLKKNGTNLKKGELWGIIDQETLELERRATELEKIKISKSIDQLQGEQNLFIEKQQTALDQITTQKAELVFARDTQGLSPKLLKRLQQAIVKLDERATNIKKALNTETLELDLQTAKDELQLNLDRKLKSFDTLNRRSHLKADFDGTLNILIDNPNKESLTGTPQWIDVAKAYASIINDTQYQIRLGNRNPIFNTQNRSKLIALLDDGNSRQLVRTNFTETRKIELNGVLRDEHIFTFPEKHAEYASQNVGETRTLFLYLLLDSEAYIIKKKDIALIAPKILQQSGWSGLVSHLYPGHKLLHIGPKTLAVSKANGDKNQ